MNLENETRKNPQDCVQAVTRTTPVFMAVSEILSVLISLAGLVVLLGWALDIPVLKSVLPGLVTMKANTALCFALIGFSLWSLQIKRRDNPFFQRLGLIFSLAVFAIGLLTLSEYLFGLDLGIDQFLFKELPGAVLTSSPGRMAFNTAFNFGFIGLALSLLASETKNRCFVAQILMLPAGGISTLSFVGYLYHADPLILGLHFSTAMALHTVVLFLLVFFGILFCRPGCGIMTLVSSDALGSKMIRRLFPVTVSVPLILGWIKLQGQITGVMSNEFGVSIVATGNMVVTTSYVLFLSFWLNRADAERKRVEEARRDAEIRFRLLFEKSPDGIVIVDPATAQFLEFNEAVHRQLGYSREEFAQLKLSDLEVVETSEETAAHIARIMREGRNDFETRHRTRQGEIRNIYVTAQFTEIMGRSVYHCVWRDITAIKEAEEALRSANERYRVLVEGTDDLITIVDPQGRFTFVNHSAEKIFGLKPEDCVGRFAFDFVHPDDRERTQAAFEGWVRDKKRQTIFQNRQVNKNGRVFEIFWNINLHFTDSGEVEQVISFARDISELKRAEEALREQEILLAGVASQVPGMLYQFMMRPDGTYCVPYSSAGVEKIFGCLPEDVRDTFEPIFKVILPEDQTKITQTINESIKGLTPWMCEYRVQLPGKPVRWISGNSIPRKMADSSIVWSGYNLDVTERKKAEEEIRTLNIELEERVRRRTAELATSVKEQEAFSYSVAHDLKAPLRAMAGFANILSEDYAPKLDDNGRRVIGVINDNAKNMGQMIDDLLKLSHLGRVAMSFVDIDVTALVRSVWHELKEGFYRDRSIALDVKPLPAARADPLLVRQIFTNLISNAMKFTARKEKAEVEIGGYDKDGECVYYIKDNGAGFDMKYKDKLFETFQRIHTQDEFGGTGIGLAIVKGAVLRHGGRVWAKGEVDQGATFYFALPKGG